MLVVRNLSFILFWPPSRLFPGGTSPLAAQIGGNPDALDYVVQQGCPGRVLTVYCTDPQKDEPNKRYHVALCYARVEMLHKCNLVTYQVLRQIRSYTRNEQPCFFKAFPVL